jgi:serine/threonine protein kinase/thioredoxin-like negative regulator of GroEL
MNPAAPAWPPAEVLTSRLRRRLGAIFRAWKKGTPPDARAVLDACPDLWHYPSAVLDLAYEEFALRLEAGEQLDVPAFCARFPLYGSEIGKMLETHEGLAGNLHLLEDGPTGQFPRPGERFGDYKVLRELGRGSFARVYLALEESTGERPVALKLSLGSPSEARLLGRLAHPNVVPVWSAHRDPASSFFVVCMPFLGSTTLNDVLNRVFPTPQALPPRRAAVLLDVIRTTAQPGDPPPVPDVTDPRLAQGTYEDGVLRLGVQLAEALAFLHGQGVCHHDLKPSNVLLSPGGRPLLLDFNLAKDDRETRSIRGGSLPYVAPEQVRWLLNRPYQGFDARTDLFDLGLILYELLTGKHPFGARPLPQKLPELEQYCRQLLKQQRAGPPPLRAANPRVSRAVAGLIEQCLAYHPAQRLDAATLAAGLRRHLARSRRPALRFGTHWIVGLLILLVAVGLRIGANPSPERDFQNGQAALRAGDPHEADRLFDRALQADSDRAEFWFARGRARLSLGEVRSALAFFEEADRRRRDGPTLVCLAYCLAALQHHEPALQTMDQARDSGHESASLLNNRAFVLLQLHRVDEAQRALADALRLDPDLPAAHYNRAVLALWQTLARPGAVLSNQAVEDVRFAVARCPASASLFGDAARICALASGPDAPDREEVLRYVRQAIELGADAKALLRDPLLRTRLGERPELKEACPIVPNPGSPTLNPGLALPLVD